MDATEHMKEQIDRSFGLKFEEVQKELDRALLLSRVTLEGGWPPEPRGRRWVLFRKFQVLGKRGEVYLTRWRLLETPLFGILLHRISAPDHDQELHDHPWSFLSLVLHGHYWEQSNLWLGERLVRLWNFRSAEHAHRISGISHRAVWTLVFRGPRRRTWGFYTADGWIPWHVFLNATEKQ